MDTSAPRAQTPLSSITGSSASNSFGRDSPVFAKICEADDLINQELYEDALLPLAKAIFLSPNESILYIARAEVYLALCDIASAIQNYKKAVKLEWGPEISQHPGNSLSTSALQLCELHAKHARHYLSLGRFEEAAAEAGSAMTMRPLHAPYRELTVLAWVGAKEHDKALEEIHKLIAASPRQPEYYLLRCRIHLLTNKLEPVVDDLARLTRLAPEHPEVQKLTGDLSRWTDELAHKATDCMNSRQYEQSLSMLARAVNLNPEDSALYHRQGVVHRLAGNLEDAMHFFEVAIEKSGGPRFAPDSCRQLRLLHNELGCQYHSWGMYVEAIDKFDAAIRGIEGSCDLDEVIAKIYANRADCYQTLGVDDKALQDYEMCCSLLKDSTDTVTKQKVAAKCAASCFKRGQLAVHFGEFARALTFFTKSITLSPEVSDYYYERAVVACRLEMHKQQREDLEKVLRLEPHHNGALKMLERICPHHKVVKSRTIM